MHTVFLNSEYSILKSVLLYKPGPEIEFSGNPEEISHIGKIDFNIMEKEYNKIIDLYTKLNVNVNFINSKKIGQCDDKYLYNLMYTRDLFFMTPEGPILSKMKSPVRSEEVKYAKKFFEYNKIPIKKEIAGNGTFEGADALWLNNRLVIVGIGNRTNHNGFLQLKEELEDINIKCYAVKVPPGIQHLLGVVQFIDKDTAMLRTDLLDDDSLYFLRQYKIKIIDIHENPEVRQRQAMNIVTISPRRIIMPTNCPQTKAIYEKNNITIAGEVNISQLINGAGGLACATGILARTLVSQ